MNRQPKPKGRQEVLASHGIHTSILRVANRTRIAVGWQPWLCTLEGIQSSARICKTGKVHAHRVKTISFFPFLLAVEPCLRQAVQRVWCNLPANYNWDICTQQNYAASEAVIIPGKLEGRAMSGDICGNHVTHSRQRANPTHAGRSPKACRQLVSRVLHPGEAALSG